MQKKLPGILSGCLIIIGVCVLLVIGMIAWIYLNYAKDSQAESKAEDQEMKAFIEEKYGMEAKIIDETEANFVDGHSYRLAFEGQEDLVFTVTEHVDNYATIYRDDYQVVLATHETQQQIEDLMPQLEELGFTTPSKGKMVEHLLKEITTGDKVRFLTLDSEYSYETHETAEIEALTELLGLVRENNLNIQVIRISSRQDDSATGMDLREMDGIENAEQVEAYLVKRLLSDLGPASKRMQTKWQDAAAQAETGRFRFYDQWQEQWISCQEVNDTGDCTNLLANVTFEPGKLSQKNLQLEEDLDAIFGFFDSITPKLTTVDLLLVDPEREGDPVRFFLAERANYDSTEQLIQDLVKD